MKRFYSFIFISLFLIASNAHAKTWVITFGSYFYSDSTLTVNVGDTIVWTGAPFSDHPLSLVSAPPNAMMFSGITSGNDGSNYQYVVSKAGVYHYHCDFHNGPPHFMSGTFTAAAAGVEIPQQMNMIMDPIYPNPAQNESMVHFTLQNPAHVTLRIYNATGTLIQTPTDENMEAGFHMLMIDTKDFASGSYQYVLQAGDAVLERSAIVVK